MTVDVAKSDHARSARPLGAADHDRFLAICGRHQIEPDRAEDVWRDLVALEARPVERPGRRLSPAALATVVAGTLLLALAGIWWVALVTSAAGAPGLLALALAWVAVAGTAAELVRRRATPYVDAAFSLVAVAYVPVAVGSVEYMLAGWSFGSHWWGRVPVEVAALAAGSAALWRFRQPLVTMLAPTAAVGALIADAVISSCDGWDKDITRWPTWVAFIALGAAAAVTAVTVGLDRRAHRDAALWPALLADAATIAAILGTAAAANAGSRGFGLAATLAGAAVFARGALVGRLAQIGIGAAVFWIGVILIGARWGNLAVAGLTTLAGISMIAGAVVVARRSSLIEQRRRAVAR